MEYPKDYLEIIKRNIENKYKKHLEINRALYNLVTSAIEQINAKELRDTEMSLYDAVVFSILTKNRKHYNAVQELCKLGFGEEAGLIVRSMTNAVIDLTYISRHGKAKLSERFVRFDWIIKWQKIKIREILDEDGGLPPLKGEELKKWNEKKFEIRTEIDKFKRKYKSEQTKQDWSGYFIRTKAEKAGKDMKLLYHTIYRYNSDIEHGNAAALNNYVKDDIPGKIQFLSEPSESHVEENLRESFNIFVRIARIFYKQFKLKQFDEEAETLIDDFLKLYNESNPA